MLFYVQMKWKLRDLSLDDLFRLEAAEVRHAQSQRGENAADPVKVVGIWKVASQHRVIAIVDVETAEDLDRNSMFRLPMRNHIEFEEVWPVSDYEIFARDVADYVQSTDSRKPRGATSL